MVIYLLKVLIPFYLVDKIEMVLLIATFFPPVIVALLNRGVFGDPAKARSPKTCPDNPGPGMGGWRTYRPQYCDGAAGEVDNSFWHGFDILIVIKIYLAAAVLWTYAYYKGEEAKDGWPPKDPNQRNCKILKVTPTPDSGAATELTYSIVQDYTVNNHADSCGFKKSGEYYAHFIPPSLMVIVGMGLPLPNITIETTVSRFVFIMELTFIVLGTLDIALESTITSVEAESKTGCFETTSESNISSSSSECNCLTFVEGNTRLDRVVTFVEPQCIAAIEGYSKS